MIKRLGGLDSTLAFRREGYAFASTRCDRMGTDAFRTRLLGLPTVFMRGPAATAFFYSGGRFTRQGALPPTVKHLLQDNGSVQTLDGEDHRHRKGLFLNITGPLAVRQLCAEFERELSAQEAGWPDRVVLHNELGRVLTAAVSRWAGIPLDHKGLGRRTQELTAMIDNAGRFGPRNWAALWLRRRAERWATAVVRGIRSGGMEVPPGSAAGAVADYIGPDGRQLKPEIAAVELLNVLRPVVAVARFMVFAALALEEQPRWKAEFAAGRYEMLEAFVHEVRRFYPFFPVIAGRALGSFEWEGHRFSKGQRVVLDLYGTNHDRRVWDGPAAFKPERFQTAPGPNELVPQGGGNLSDGHRCPGEDATVELVKTAVRVFASWSGWMVPAQDTTITLTRIPALPRSGLILQRVRPSGSARPAMNMYQGDAGTVDPQPNPAAGGLARQGSTNATE